MAMTYSSYDAAPSPPLMQRLSRTASPEVVRLFPNQFRRLLTDPLAADAGGRTGFPPGFVRPSIPSGAVRQWCQVKRARAGGWTGFCNPVGPVQSRSARTNEGSVRAS